MTLVLRTVAARGSYRLPWIAFNSRSVALLPLERIFVRFLDSGVRFFFFIGPLRYLSIALLRICEHGQCNYHGRDGKSFHALGHIFRGIVTKCLMPITAKVNRRLGLQRQTSNGARRGPFRVISDIPHSAAAELG